MLHSLEHRECKPLPRTVLCVWQRYLIPVNLDFYIVLSNFNRCFKNKLLVAAADLFLLHRAAGGGGGV